MISAAVGRGGETMISAQTIEAFWTAVKHVKPLSVGLNCSLGPDLMYPFLSELSEKLNAALLKLSEHHRMVVTLHDIQGLSHEEIGKIMDCNVGTVRSRLFYARQQLQAHLSDYLK